MHKKKETPQRILTPGLIMALVASLAFCVVALVLDWELPIQTNDPTIPKNMMPAPEALQEGAGVRTAPGPADGAGTGAMGDATGGMVRGAAGNATYPAQDGAIPYEETLGSSLEEAVKKIDYALLKTMAAQGLKPDTLHLKSVETRQDETGPYHYQVIALALTTPPAPFLSTLLAELKSWAVDATVQTDTGAQGEPEWTIAAQGVVTHKLRITSSVPAVAEQPEGPEPAGRMVVVIDDIGENMSFAKRLAALDYPVTFSIWPRSTHAHESAELAHGAGLEVLVHQPMEPISYPKANPGPGAVFRSMDQGTVRLTVNANLDMVPWAVGLNNHMGSGFSQDEKGVGAVLDVVAARGMLILDSFTHSKSCIARLGKARGLPTLQRDIFLDVERDTAAILHQLRKAARVARATGEAVAIGHPHPETVEALELWQRDGDKDVRMTTLVDLLDTPPAIAATLAAKSTAQTATAQ